MPLLIRLICNPKNYILKGKPLCYSHFVNPHPVAPSMFYLGSMMHCKRVKRCLLQTNEEVNANKIETNTMPFHEIAI